MGWPALPVPPTLLFCLEMEQPDPWHFLGLMGIDLARVLHGEQEFDYLAPAWAGDTLTFAVRIADIYDKRGGALEFVTKTDPGDQPGRRPGRRPPLGARRAQRGGEHERRTRP